VNKCLGASNAPLYYVFAIFELANSTITLAPLLTSIDSLINDDLALFIVFLSIALPHFCCFLKKVIVMTISMLTNETQFEREMRMRLPYLNKKQVLSMSDRPEYFNPFNRVRREYLKDKGCRDQCH